MNRDDPRNASRDRLLIAVGGNAIHPEGIRGTSEEQMQIAAEAKEDHDLQTAIEHSIKEMTVPDAPKCN